MSKADEVIEAMVDAADATGGVHDLSEDDMRRVLRVAIDAVDEHLPEDAWFVLKDAAYGEADDE